MYNSSDVAERIKQTAKIRNVSVKQLLSDVGLGVNTMSNMKASMPKSDTLAKIADYLEVSVDYLLGRSDLPTVGTPLNTELVQNYNLLNNNGKQKVVTYSADLLKIDEYKKELP